MSDILLATYSASLAKLLADKINKIGFDVRWCLSARSANEAFQSAQNWQPFKVVIIDCKLPINDGSLEINEDEGIDLVRYLIPLNNNNKNTFRASIIQVKPTCQFIILTNTWVEISHDIHSMNNVSFVCKGTSLGLKLEREIRKGLHKYWERQQTLARAGFFPIIITGLLIIIEDLIHSCFSGFSIVALISCVFVAVIQSKYLAMSISATHGSEK